MYPVLYAITLIGNILLIICTTTITTTTSTTTYYLGNVQTSLSAHTMGAIEAQNTIMRDNCTNKCHFLPVIPCQSVTPSLISHDDSL